MTGIVSYGFYIPTYRIKIADIANQWGKCAEKVEHSLQIKEKAVAGIDEDVLTMAYEASEMAFTEHEKIKSTVGAVFMGSETFPYAVKPSSTALAQWLSLSHNYLAYDTQFACKAGTGAIISAAALVKSGEVEHALVCASDKANAAPEDALEYSAGSGANAWILGRKDVILELQSWHSYSSDTPDFWRRAKASYPSHAGRFTGEPSYFHHIGHASQALLKKTGMKPSDFSYAVFHMPNGTFPLKVAHSLGFTKEQVLPSYVVPQLGNSYSASALMGLVSVLDIVQQGERIFFASYGSGAGSDAMIFQATDLVEKKRRDFKSAIKNKQYIDYAHYLKYMNML